MANSNHDDTDEVQNQSTSESIDSTRRKLLAGGTAAGVALPFTARAASEATGLVDPAPLSSGPSTFRMPQGWRAFDLAFYEMSANDPNFLEIYAYTGAPSYIAGEAAQLHVSTTAETFDYIVWRDGPEREIVFQATDVKGVFTETPVDAYANGCGWPVLAEIPVDPSWRSGVYIVELRATRGSETKVSEAGFVVRGQKKSKIVFMLTTGTWTAYNCWGGANSYLGIHGADGVGPATHLSLDRPYERGFWVAPPNYPYLSTKPEQVRYKHERHYTGQPTNGYAIMMGYGWGANSAGWAVDNKPLAVWAEENGYEMEYIDQYDLENVPGVLDGYDCMVIAGHDEYWSWGQRDTLDAFLEAGGNLARFGANMIWQVRMEEEGRQQICYKLAPENDPVKGHPLKGHLLATVWDHKDIGRPMAQTFCLNGMQGIYACYDGGSPRSSGGFTVYRPKHWAFEDTGLIYGDTFGMEEGIVGYETDAVDYVIEHGLPRPSDVNFPLDGTEILAVTPAMVDQFDAGGPGSAVVSMVLGDDFFATKWAEMVEGKTDEDTVKKYRYGSAQIATAPKGKGEIFCAGTVYWFLGLKWRDRTTEQITHNVLKRYTS